MIKNIPNKYNNSLLKDKINNLFHDSYDFFYLPMDFQVIYFIAINIYPAHLNYP